MIGHDHHPKPPSFNGLESRRRLKPVVDVVMIVSGEGRAVGA
jgi:hypothetical protein